MRSFDWTGLWQPVVPPWEIAFRATVVYAFVHLMLRLLGRRGLGRYSISDVVLLFLIAVAMRQTIVAEDRSLTSGMVALATLVTTDALLARLAHRSPTAARILEGPVRQIVRDGEIIADELRKSRLSLDDLHSRLRAHGHESLADVEKAFLERSGQVTFIFRR
jgi:uncharacterized membrane protein YcaP (DUF421 family)